MERYFVILLILISTQLCCVQFSRADICLGNCTCTVSKRTVTINCMGNKSRNIEDHINSYLQSHQRITSLRIYNTDMRNARKLDISPLTKLTDVSFINNTLISFLPKSLFAGNTMLVNIQMINSSLEELDDGVLNGLNHLKTIDFTFNNISRIAKETFIHLPEIEHIILTNNSLEEVDVWPLYLMVNSSKYITVELNKNRIEHFTNYLNWTYHCGMKPANGYLFLKNNNIKHMIDLTNGYNLTLVRNVLCLFINDNFQISFEENKLVCDCIDFEFYKYLKKTTKSGTANNLRCDTAPDKSLIDKNIIRIDLTKFVCDVHSGCPKDCVCLQEPANMTFHINCQGRGLTALPNSSLTYSNMSDYKYKFNLQENHIGSLSTRPYLSKLYEANFARNGMKYVDSDAAQQIINNTQYIYLDNNNLQYLPSQIKHLNFDKVIEISLHSNHWACTCDRRWILKWMKRIENKLIFPDGILCGSPPWLHKKSILSLHPEDFCNNPNYEKLNQIVIFSVMSVLVTLLLLVVPAIVIYTKRVWVYKKFKWHPFDWDECEGENKRFDAFISYAEEDKLWVRDLVSQLEQDGYKLLIHHRDFDGGKPVIVNVGEAIDISKRTICVMSRAFVNSQMCKWEFDTALSVTLQNKKSRLVIIRLEDVPKEDMPRSIFLYMKRHTYIDIDNEYVMDNIKYSMPINRMGTRQNQPSTSVLVTERTPLIE